MPANRRRKSGGWETYAKVGGHLQSQWWPIDTPISVMDEWVAARKRQRSGRAHAGTFAAKVPDYLLTIAAMPTAKERKHHMTIWIAEFGDRSPLAVVRADVQAVLQRLEASGKSASYVRHLRSALSSFYTVMYPDERNPARAASVPRAPRPEPRAISRELAQKIIDAMPNRGRAGKDEKRPDASQSKAMLRLMLWTGWPPAQIRRLRARDLHLDQGVAWVRPRRKGTGTAGEMVPLLPEAVDALRAFLPYLGAKLSPSSIHKCWRRACAKLEKAAAKDGVILDLRHTVPYSLRHGFAVRALMDSGGDLAGTQRLMLHSSSAQTLRYAQQAVDPRAAAVIQRMAAKDGHNGDSPQPTDS